MRYVLIDFNHLAYKCAALEPLTTTANVDGNIQVIDTTIPTHTIKNVFNYSGRGQFHTGVFLEGGGNPERTAHFAAIAAKTDKASGYKGTRNKQTNPFYKGIELAVNLMLQGQVSVYRQQGFEADDLIMSMVQKIKSIDTETPIDIITNDSDLLPLVDDQVSVYMRGTRQHAEPGCPERRLYYQVTPETWDEYLSYTSAYRNFRIPYNSMLLYKLIRGDSADNYSGAVKGYGGVKYSQLMQQMEADGVDFPAVFRYGLDFDVVLRPILSEYFEEEAINHMAYVYAGVQPKYHNLAVPKQVEPGYLQLALNPVKINIIR